MIRKWVLAWNATLGMRASSPTVLRCLGSRSQNIEAVVGRGEHLELLVDKSDAFSANARAFQKESSGLKRAMWWKNVKMIAMMLSLVLAIGLAVLWMKCGWMMHACRATSS